VLADRFRKLMETLDPAAIEDVYAPDALIDANVPSWRFQVKGLDAIIAQYGRWFPHGGVKLVSIREWPAEFGSVVETTQTEPDGKGSELFSRQLHVMFTDGDKVTRQMLYCTGTWDADTRERQAREAPMYDP